MAMNTAAKDGASPVVHANMTPVASSVLIPETGEGVLSSSPASLTGSTSAVALEPLTASEDAVGAKDTVSTSWTQGFDFTTPALGDCSLASGAERGTSAGSLNLSNSSDGAPTCRICCFGDTKQPLLEPCNCRGTIGFVHRDCLERWIQRTGDTQCQVCHFRFPVRKQSEPAWRLLSNVEARRPVLGYMVLCAVFALGIAFIFTLAWLYAVRLPSRVGERLASVVVVMLAVQNVLWLYFPFVSFMYLHKAYKKWREESTCLKLVLTTDQTTGPPWPTFRFWRTGGGSREPVLAYVSAE